MRFSVLLLALAAVASGCAEAPRSRGAYVGGGVGVNLSP